MPDSLTPDPNCPYCGGLGFVTRDVPVGDPDFGRAFPCRCLQQSYKARELSRLRALGNMATYTEKTFATFEIDHDLIDEANADLREVFANLAPERKERLIEEDRRMLNVAGTLAFRYAEQPQGWLLFEGTYGTGKTHLAAAIANWRIMRGDAVLFITSPDLLDHLKSAFSPQAETAYDDLFERIRQAPLLVIDDLGAESQTQWAGEKLYQLFNDRHRRMLPTVITTNRDTALLEGRIRSRLLDQSLTMAVKLSIPDRRSSMVTGTWRESDLSRLDRYADMTFETFDLRQDELGKEKIDQKQIDQLQHVVQHAYAYAQRPEGWLAIIGEPGCGKTHLAAAIAHLQHTAGTRTLFVNVADLLNYLRGVFEPFSKVSYDSRMEEIRRAPLLILDNVALRSDLSSVSPWARDQLYEILTYRFDYRLPTVITTNLTPDKMDARLRSRLYNKTYCTVAAISLPAYTGGKSRAAPLRSPTRKRE